MTQNQKFRQFILLFLAAAATSVASNSRDLVVAGYLPDYRFYINLNQTVLALTDLYLFSIDPVHVKGDSIIEDNCCLDDHHLQQALAAREYKSTQQPDSKRLKLWLTIGGGGRSSGFYKLRNKDDRQALYQHLIDTATKYDLDGIDFDNEQFGRSHDYQNYMLFLREATKYIKKNNPKLLVSVAMHPRQHLALDIIRSIDRVNLMTYDMQIPTYEGVQNVNKDRKTFHADTELSRIAVEQLLQTGIKSCQVVLGIPAYARHYKDFNMVKTIAELYDDGLHSIDDVDNTGEYNGYLYESCNVTKQKLKLVKKKGLGGIFVWELGQDKQTADKESGVLLTCLHDNAVKRKKRNGDDSNSNIESASGKEEL